MDRSSRAHEGATRPPGSALSACRCTSQTTKGDGARRSALLAGVCDPRGGGFLSENRFLNARDDIGYRERCTPHGFRSTFRDWAAEETNFPAEVVEMALAHAIKE